MRRRAHARRVLEHCAAALSAADVRPVAALLAERKVRLGYRLSRRIVSGFYATAGNDLVRDLSKDVPDREAFTALYGLVDAVHKTAARKTSNAALRRDSAPAKLEREFEVKAPERKERIDRALAEEARLRGLSLKPSLLRDHCHVWKHHFDYSTGPRLKKLLAMDDNAFARLTWSFAAELAWAARARRLDGAFDWREFAWAGFSKRDFERFASERTKALAALGLPADAEPEHIKARFKQLAKSHHPDTGGSAEAMAKLNEAYGALMKDGAW